MIVYPTDTVWGIGCDATNPDAIDKVYELKKREETKALICLVSNFKMLEQYVEEIPEMAYDILKYSKNLPPSFMTNLFASLKTWWEKTILWEFAWFETGFVPN